jgi:hypothetical protein
MFLVSSDKFPFADGKTRNLKHSPLKKRQHPYDEKIPIEENTTLSNRKHEKKK